jgi:hypothetical protein
MKDIVSYLQSKGYTVTRVGQRYITNSPIKKLRYGQNDSSPSFVIYGDGGAKCFSTGWYGDVVSLSREFGEQVPIGLPEFKPLERIEKKPWPGEVPSYHLDITDRERSEIVQYATSRKITRGYIPAAFIEHKVRYPSLLFVHQNERGEVCGGKFRTISGKRRFTLRGVNGFYCLENLGPIPPTLYLVESETSANSLWEITTNSVIVSAGGVDNVPDRLPERYQGLPGYVVVDYDGNEALYQKRIKKYNHLGLKPLKLILPKGDDINSLYCKNEEYLILL